MNRADVEEGKRLLKEFGAIKMVAAVSCPPSFNPEEVGTVLENKANGNMTYGYFSPEDEDELYPAIWPLLVWLMNHAEAMLACADVAIEAHIEIPALGLERDKQLTPSHVSILFAALATVIHKHDLPIDKILADNKFVPELTQWMVRQGLSAEQASRVLRNAGLYF